MATNDDRTSQGESEPAQSKGLLCLFFGYVFGWVLRIVGIPMRHRSVLEDTDSGKTLSFQALALVVSSAAFAVTSMLYSTELVGNPWWTSLGISLVAGAILFAIDRMTVIDLRVNPTAGRGLAWVVRVATIVMALMMAVLSGVKTHRDDIARIQEANSSVVAADQLKGSAVSNRMAAANSALKQADADALRQADLRKGLTAAQARIAKAEAELERELGGAFDPGSGAQRAKGRGPKALHWEAARNEARQQASALQAELLALGDVESRMRQANSDIKAMQDEAMRQGRAGQQGAAKKIEALIQLLREEWTAVFSLGYGAVLALLPEMLLLRAMSRSRTLELDYEILTPIERRRSQALAHQAARAMKEDIAQRAKRQSLARSFSRAAPAGTRMPAFGTATAVPA